MYEIGNLMLITHDLTQKRHDKSHRPAPVVLVEHQGMGNAPAFGHPSQRLDGIVVPYDLIQPHQLFL